MGSIVANSACYLEEDLLAPRWTVTISADPVKMTAFVGDAGGDRATVGLVGDFFENSWCMERISCI
jgi:hypothetical protein